MHDNFTNKSQFLVNLIVKYLCIQYQIGHFYVTTCMYIFGQNTFNIDLNYTNVTLCRGATETQFCERWTYIWQKKWPEMVITLSFISQYLSLPIRLYYCFVDLIPIDYYTLMLCCKTINDRNLRKSEARWSR